MRVGHIICAERNQFFLYSNYMNAAALQAFEIDIPSILKGHSRYAQKMTLGALQEVCQGRFALAAAFCVTVNWSGCEFGLAVLPMLANIFPRLFGSILPIGMNCLLGEFKLGCGD